MQSTYTMLIENAAGAEEVVARGVSLPRALVLALEHGGKGKPAIVYGDVGELRYFAIGWRPAADGPFECATYTVLQPSQHPGHDADRAFEVFEQVLLQHPGEFWRGRVVADQEYEHLQHHEESDVTEARLTTFLPGFGGFHGTRWTDLFPFALESCADRFARYEAADELTAADLGAILRETSEASRFFDALANSFCRRYDAEISRWLGFELELKFDEFDIPPAYGGTTDFILATMPASSAAKLLERSAAEGHQRLLGSIRDRLAADDGVVAEEDEAVKQWLAQPIERWSRTELCDLLAGFVDPEIDERLYADMTGGSDVSTAFEAAVDWERFAATAEARRRALSGTAKI